MTEPRRRTVRRHRQAAQRQARLAQIARVAAAAAPVRLSPSDPVDHCFCPPSARLLTLEDVYGHDLFLT